MAIRGRKPQSAAMKKHRGNPGRRPLSEEPAFEVLPLTPPEWLGGEALAEWNLVSDPLQKNNLVSGIDRAVLVSYCEAWGSYSQACIDVQKYGAVLTSEKTGQKYLSPYLNAKSMAEKQMRACVAELGMSPSSRTRINVSPPEKIDDAKSQFCGGPKLSVVG
jgi:P27 family predicted phage terminase small subunit